MNITVCLCANTLYYPKGGGHLWVFLNWAMGLRALGCKVIWLEQVLVNTPAHQLEILVTSLKNNLKPYGLAESLALYLGDSESSINELTSYISISGCLNLEAATEADLLLNLAYFMPEKVLRRFKRSVLVDIDPGLTQIWISEGQMSVAPHDVYISIGETVGQPEALFPDCGLHWLYTPPPVYLPAWPITRANDGAPFSTITGWWGEWVKFQGDSYENSKRAGFMPYLDLPLYTTQPLELAISLGSESDDLVRSHQMDLLEQGWRVRFATTVASSPLDYRHYIQSSRGEFSCAKPSCIHLQNAWISDRTLCYLASGKPAIVQYTGLSRFLPDSGGLLRFKNIDEAVKFLEIVSADYDHQCTLARELAEEYFDAEKVLNHLLERVLA